ncbi:MAG: Crp/Fnr family transcriptional regulator [Bacteroidota bacterium]
MPEKSKFWYLKHLNIFEGMPEEEMMKVEKMSSISTVKKRQIIFFPEQPSQLIFFLKEGHVKLSRVSEDGREVILDVIGPGELFGELSLLDETEHRTEIAEALDEVVICAIDKRDFEELLRRSPELNLQITKRMGLRLRKFEERVSDLVFKDVKKRIASFLLRYAEEFGKMKKGIVTISPFLSHQEIAFLTASARQTVTTTLNEMRGQGVIDFSRKGLIINDLPKLQKIAR